MKTHKYGGGKFKQSLYTDTQLESRCWEQRGNTILNWFNEVKIKEHEKAKMVIILEYIYLIVVFAFDPDDNDD